MNSVEIVLRLEGSVCGLAGSVPPPSFHSSLGPSQDRQGSCTVSTTACNWFSTGGTRQDDSHSLSRLILKRMEFYPAAADQMGYL